MATDLILGTAGHIDHGKTALVRALTGADTDRLPEERRRGITIELGFAELCLGDFRLGIVDVPGHERFVRNMLAGATGMDLAMLVVAADDSVKPQTREHLEILRLLDLPAGVIALTKCDLAEPDWIELVEEEVREAAADSFLAGAPIVRTSATTGEGLDELREALVSAARQASGSARLRRIDGPFRMAVDRSFTMAGHGTVVTGSVGSGRVRVGDSLSIEPSGIAVRVRGLENHGRNVDEIFRGQRAAINLAGVHHQQMGRGQELATPGHLVPSRLLTVWLRLLASAPRPLRNRTRIRVHLGTTEVLSSVVLLDGDRFQPGKSGPAQLFLGEPVVATWNQPFVARSESPVITVGGGHVLDPNAEKIRKPNERVLRLLGDLMSDDPVTRSSAALFFSGLRGWHPRDLARTAGIESTDAIHQALLDGGQLKEIVVSPTRTVRLHRFVFDELGDRIAATLARLHEQNPLRSTLDRSELASRCAHLGDEALFGTVLQSIAGAGRVRLSGKGVALVGHGPKLSAGERKLLGQLIQQYRQAGFQPPTVSECQRQAASNRDSVPQLIALAAADGDLVEISPPFCLHADVERQLRATLREELADGAGLTLSQIREILNTTRKYAVPICEYLDRVGFTQRNGDLRVLAER